MNVDLFELIVQWAKEAYNWLKNFIKLVWGVIVSYWPKIKQLVKEWLDECEEVVVLDGRLKGGKELIEALRNNRPSEVTDSDINGLVAIGIKPDGKISKVGDMEAEVQQLDQYDEMSQKHNGILRIQG